MEQGAAAERLAAAFAPGCGDPLLGEYPFAFLVLPERVVSLGSGKNVGN